MSRKRGKHKKDDVSAVPAEILAEGSGPVDVAAHVVTTIDEVATTEDVATSDDVMTPDDVVAAEPAPKPRKKKAKRAKAEAAPAGDPLDEDAPITGIPVREPKAHELDNAELAALIEAEAARSEPVDARAAGGVEPSGDRASFDADGARDDFGDDGETDDGGEVDDSGDGDGDGGGRFPTSANTMDSIQLKHLVESLVFASDKPVTVQRLRQLTRVGDVRRLEVALTELEVDYRERGVVLQAVSGGYQFRTRTQFSAWVQQLIAGRPVRLSRAQLETLAIIAYRQPITRPEIDDIRGVDSTATVKLLLDRMLIRSLGKREEVGRPTLYGTTKEFLDFFSLGNLRELPTLREYSELTAESRKVMSDRLGISHDDEPGPGGGGSRGGGGGSTGGGGPGGSFDPGGFDPGADPSAESDGSEVDGPAQPSSEAGAMSDFFAAADALDRSEAGELDDDDAVEDGESISADLLAGDGFDDDVVAPADVRPVERPAMDEQLLDPRDDSAAE